MWRATKPLLGDLRSRAVEAVAAGMSCRAVADRFRLARSTMVKWMRRRREAGSCASRPQGGDKRSGRIQAHAEESLGLISAKVDITLAEIAEHIAAATSQCCSLGSPRDLPSRCYISSSNGLSSSLTTG